MKHTKFPECLGKWHECRFLTKCPYDKDQVCWEVREGWPPIRGTVIILEETETNPWDAIILCPKGCVTVTEEEE